MKMVSQLTRQAMSRHRIVSLKVPTTASAVTTVPAVTAMPATEPVRTLYASPTPSTPPVAPRETISARRPPAPSPQARPRTIYQQLMVSHDRMRERHVPVHK